MATAAEKQAEIEEFLIRQRQEDLEWMMSSQRGRRILFRLIEETRSFEVSFTGNSGSYYNDGRKSVGLEYFHEVMAISPDSFTLMWQEHMKALKEQQRKLEQSEDD